MNMGQTYQWISSVIPFECNSWMPRNGKQKTGKGGAALSIHAFLEGKTSSFKTD
jgi:hypothetical protein